MIVDRQLQYTCSHSPKNGCKVITEVSQPPSPVPRRPPRRPREAAPLAPPERALLACPPAVVLRPDPARPVPGAACPVPQDWPEPPVAWKAWAPGRLAPHHSLTSGRGQRTPWSVVRPSRPLEFRLQRSICLRTEREQVRSLSCVNLLGMQGVPPSQLQSF